MASSHQVLHNDVLWQVAKHLTSAHDILSLGLVSSSVWNVVRTELYRVEVIQARDIENPADEDNSDDEENPVNEENPIDAPNRSALAATTLEQQQALNTRLHHSRMPAIHFAIRNGYDSTTVALIQAAKAHWLGYLDVVWSFGLTPLHLAAATGNTEVVQALHMGGCALNAEVYLPTGRAQIFDKVPNLPELSTLDRYQLHSRHYWLEQVDSLTLATIHRNPSTTQYLLKHMDLKRPSLPNGEPISPLHVAALVGDAEIVETLLGLNYALETSRTVENVARPETALHYAAVHKGDNTAVLGILLASGASLGTTAMSGMTALEAAFRNPTSPANAHFLLDYSIQTDDLQVNDWESTFTLALDRSHMRVPLQALLDKTEIISEEMMQSALRHLISYRHYDEDAKLQIKFLIRNLFPAGSKYSGYTIPWDECNINAPYYPMEAPETILQQAVSKRAFNPRLLQDLLPYRDWELEATDVKGRTAFDYAIHHRVYDAAFMLAHGAQCRVEVPHLCREAGDGALAVQAA
ncbi:hypothetical protein PG988_014350 [Apiospora saccharicola]